MKPALEHLHVAASAIRSLESQIDAIDAWGATIAEILLNGGRLLAAGNGGSAAQAQHLTAELVGRYAEERQPLSAIPLHGDTSSLTALSNDYGSAESFARQVRAHGRAGDVFVGLSTSGRSNNVIAAARDARAMGLETLAITGPRPNLLADACGGSIAVDAPTTAAVQEAHLVVIHLICESVDRLVLTGGLKEGSTR
jgi:D-sedoheptulose 7-phosphate isomerase